MKLTSTLHRVIALTLGTSLAHLAAGATPTVNAPTPLADVAKRVQWKGSATAQVDVHAFDGGFNDGAPEFVSRYAPLRGLNGDDYPGYYIDLSNVNLALVDSATNRPLFGVERRAFGYFNQKNLLYFDHQPVRIEFNYSLYRSQQLKPANPIDPAVPAPGVPANSIFAKFNDDSFGRTDYHTLRTDYGFELRLRPEAFGHDGSQLGDIELTYAGSDRESVRFFDYVLTRRLAGGSTWERTRWRGVNQNVKEDVNRFTLGLSAKPFNWIGVNYELTVEKYEREFNNASLDVIAQKANVPVENWSSPATNSGPEKFINLHNTEFWPLEQISLGWVPSTIKFVNKLKFDKQIGRGLLNFGFSSVVVDQESFTAFAQDRGFDRGLMVTTSQFANWSMRLTPTTTWTAHAVHSVRDNRSRFPAVDPQRRLYNATLDSSVYDYMNPRLDGGKHGSVFGPFIQEIDTLKLGTDVTFLFVPASSRVVAGWKRQDISRDLIFGNPAPGLVRTIDPNEAYVRPESVSDTFFVNYSGKLKSGLKLRWHNALVLADEVGLILDPQKGYKGRLSASYFWPKLWQGAGVDVFHQTRYGYNNAFTITSRSNDFTTLLSSAKQDREQMFQSAGITFNAMPSKEATAYAGYLWNRDRVDANLLLTSARRYDNNWVFVSGDRERYLSDAHTVFVGTSYQFNSAVFGTLDYSVTSIDGDLGSGLIKGVLGNDGVLDNVAHNIGASLTVALQNNISVGGRYAYARYDDAVNNAFDSAYHTFSVMVTRRF